MTQRPLILLLTLLPLGACQSPAARGPRKLNYREAIARKAVEGLMKNRDGFERGARVAIDLQDESRRGVDLDGIRARTESELYRTQLFEVTSKDPQIDGDFHGRRSPGGWKPPDALLRGVVRPSPTESEVFVITIEVCDGYGSVLWSKKHSFRIY